MWPRALRSPCKHDRRLGFPSLKRYALLGLRTGPGIPVLVFFPPPFCMRRGAQGQTDQDGRLSERSEFEPGPGWTEHRRLPRSVSEGDADSRVAFFFAYFLFGDAKRK